MTTASTALVGLLGWPVAHSRSPALHSAALEALGIDATYLPFAVPPEALAEAVGGLRALGALGANVTLPHKQAVIPHLDAVEPTALAIGAVNTIVRDGPRLVGANTDAPGLTRSLVDAGVSLADARVLVIGAGGAARAAVVGLAEAGASRVVVGARRQEAARALLEETAPDDGSWSLETRALDLGSLREVAGETDLLVQATSATLGGGPDADALSAQLPFDALPGHATVVDLVYTPRQTAVLRDAGLYGLRTVDGLGMLEWQAALAFARWFGTEPPIDAMRALRTDPE